MTTADQLAIVSKLLQPQEEAHTIAQACLVCDWSRSRVVLVLARSSVTREEAVLVLTSASLPVARVQDLHLTTAIPIDTGFRFDIESGPATVPDGVHVNIVSHRQKFLFEMSPGYHTQNLVSELYRITDTVSKQIPSSSSSNTFAWLAKYKSTDTPVTSSSSSSAGLNSRTGTTADPVSDLMAGLDVSNSAAGSLVSQTVNEREFAVNRHLRAKEEEFTRAETFRVFCGTYNVNGQSPNRDVRDWLVPPDSTDTEPPDLYAVGFQELDLSKEAFLFMESGKEDEWRAIVEVSLHPGARYSRVQTVRLVGMLLLIYCKEEHREHVTNVSCTSVATGILGLMGNKGGVGISLRFHATEICFVCSHLAAHQKEFERRNQDYNDICDRMSFSQYECPNPDYPPTRNKRIKDFVWEGGKVFWVGDLNYRINDFDVEEVKEMINNRQFDQLLEADQLKLQQQQRRAFVEFEEGPITFKPTYKYNPMTNEWDSSEKCRSPAWCDRVLWRGDGITLRKYDSTDRQMVSDHKPVYASFHVSIRVIDKAKRQKLREEIMKKLDTLENLYLPQVTVVPHEVIFDTVKFMDPVTSSITIANTGQVEVEFGFIPKPDEQSYSKQWLVAEPSSGTIQPGRSCEVDIKITVDKSTAAPLTSGQDKLYDILVLHLAGGRDMFITVEGTYIRSCFGCSIQSLVQLTVPVAELSPGQLATLERGEADKLPPEMTDGCKEAYPVPKELWFLCDLLTSLGLDQEHLFSHHGLKHEILQVREWLDTGKPVGSPPAVSIHSAAETLMIFLQSLRDPVIPLEMYQRCLDCSGNYLQCKQIVSQLPTSHKNVFEYLTAFLREVIAHSAKNGTDPVILATLFCTMFIRDPPNTKFGAGVMGEANQQMLTKKKAAFMHHFLVNDPDE